MQTQSSKAIFSYINNFQKLRFWVNSHQGAVISDIKRTLQNIASPAVFGEMKSEERSSIDKVVQFVEAICS